ncbi:hypothetical protein KOR34_25610 [Posidoniimonas corsicana]|uniref:Uncharacterized protein n=1 Tax=Posidoniimonas corsicana TaxID=1938618 RepID=A0A5C5VHZ2_9BACT|nr:hypothetical protein [Posidoniimonas corsicana]TWT37607.1 hypothetical protein KOR34_25610 [Posidoniimonas corsicana]
MAARTPIAAVVVLALAAQAAVAADWAGLRMGETLENPAAGWVDPPAETAPATYDTHIQLMSLDGSACCDGVGCGDACGCGDTCGQQEQHDGCVDRFLPRSNLPFPLLKGLTEGRDVVLPLPLGTGVVWTELNRTVAVSDVRLGLGTVDPSSVERIDVPETKFHASTQIARVDLWVLPCLNIYGIAGHTRTTGSVDVVVSDFPLPVSPDVTIDVPVSMQGPTLGWGCTTGIGAKDWFAMLDVNKSWTTFSNLDGSLTALVVTPRVGLVVDRPLFKGEVHIGAMWQDTAQTVELTINHPLLGPGLKVEVDQFEPNPWNFLVGGLWALDERLQVMVEGGMGGRSYVVSGVTIRY